MSNPRIPKDRSYKVASWVVKDASLWNPHDVCEWTYKREEGDLTVFAITKEEALATIAAHGFTHLDKDKLRQTGGRLTDHLKKSEIK